MGLYLRAWKKKDIERRAKRMADNGTAWAAVGGPWHDDRGSYWINKPSKVERIVEALAALGIAPHVWGYPWHDRVDEFVADMGRCSVSQEVVGWLLDPELGLKNHKAEADRLFVQARNSNPYMMLGLSSYGLPKSHKTFPFGSFADKETRGNVMSECDYGSPQLYYVPEPLVHRGMRAYRDVGFDHVVPSYGNYKFEYDEPERDGDERRRRAVSKTGPELEAHLQHFVTSGVPVPAMIGWAENWVTREQWRVLAEWAEKFE